MQVDPAVRGDVERRLGQQGAVGDDRAAVGRDLAQPGEEVLVARAGGLEHLDAGLLRALGDGAGDQPAAAPGGRVGPGDDGDDLVAVRGDQGVEGGDGDLGGTGEKQASWVANNLSDAEGGRRTSLGRVPLGGVRVGARPILEDVRPHTVTRRPVARWVKRD
ncbi:hypothetical protein GCM10020000_67060 [Streptomyces olivoverticillatus]